MKRWLLMTLLLAGCGSPEPVTGCNAVSVHAYNACLNEKQIQYLDAICKKVQCEIQMKEN